MSIAAKAFHLCITDTMLHVVTNLVIFGFQSLVYAYDESVLHEKMLSKSVEDKDERQYLYERASQYGDENIKIVRLQKSADPLVCSNVIFNL